VTDRSPSSAPKSRQIELDFIRGIAILMVIDFHSPEHSLIFAPFRWLGFPHFGWAGVDIFFVLSGFLVGGLLIKEWKTRGSIDARQFLIRRILKIWPQYYVYLFIVLLTRHRTLHNLWGNLLNIQNYIGGIAHTWTLAVEEHAYLILVFLLAIAARRRVRMRYLFYLLVTLAAAILINRMTLTLLGFNTFTRTDTRVDGILYGVMLAILYHYTPEQFARLQRLVWLWLGVIAMTLAFFRFAPAQPWAAATNWFLADMSGVATLLLLYRHRIGKPRPALYRLVAFIGLYSYGIYLWHVSVLDPIKTVARRLPTHLAPVWDALAPFVLGILIGIVFTKLVEFPALKLRDTLFPRRVDSAVGIPAEIEAETGLEGQPESVSASPLTASVPAAQKTAP
jgi:peptidoglycan/LPS O-acetylase OafA/YrhL